MPIFVTLYLDNQGLSIYRWEGKCLQRDLKLQNAEDAETKPKLQQYFSRQAVQAVLVLDILQESYALESVPHLAFQDRKALLARKRQQLFPGHDYVYQKIKGRRTTDRQDDWVLFAAITDESVIRPWLKILAELEVVLAGIYSLPLLLEKTAYGLRGKDNKLLVCLAEHQGAYHLRQTLFQQGRLVLSRFRYISESDKAEAAREIRDDVERSLRFASRRYQIFPDDNLSSYLFYNQQVSKSFFDSIGFSQIQLEITPVEAAFFASRQGRQLASECDFSAYIAATQSKHEKSHYHDDNAFFCFRHFMAKRYLVLASAVIAVMALGYAVQSVVDKNQMEHDQLLLSRQRAKVMQQLKETPEVPLFKGFSPDQLQQQLQVLAQISRHRISAQTILQTLSRVLDGFARIQLQAVEWGNESQQMPDDLEPALLGAVVMDPGAGGLMAETPQAAPLNIVLQAELTGFDGNYRQALAEIEQFRLALEAQQHIEQVVVIKLPVNIDDNEELIGTAQQRLERFPFTLEIHWSTETLESTSDDVVGGGNGFQPA